jgi:prepilin-type N-terminal cleavage/methylation domain-containing protein
MPIGAAAQWVRHFLAVRNVAEPSTDHRAAARSGNAMKRPAMPARSVRFVKRAGGGFTLVELMLVIAVSAVLSLVAYQQSLAAMNQSTAAAAGTQIRVIGEALYQYMVKNQAAVATATAATGTYDIASIATTLQGANSCGTGIQCMAGTGASTNGWGSAYNIRIRRLGTSAAYTYEALVITTSPWLTGGTTGNARQDLIGYAASAVTSSYGQSAMTYDATGAEALGGVVVVSAANYANMPGFTWAAGDLAYFISAGGATNAYDTTYLRLDGTNNMTGPLNVGNATTPQNILYAGNGTFTGNLTAGGNATITGSVSAAANTVLLANDGTNGGYAQMTSNSGLQFSLLSTSTALQFKSSSGGTIAYIDQSGNTSVNGYLYAVGNLFKVTSANGATGVAIGLFNPTAGNVFFDNFQGEMRVLNSSYTAETMHVGQAGQTYIAGNLNIQNGLYLSSNSSSANIEFTNGSLNLNNASNSPVGTLSQSGSMTVTGSITAPGGYLNR